MPNLAQLLNTVYYNPMKNQNLVLGLAAILGVALIAISSYQFGVISVGNTSNMGATGDTYQTAKVYSKIITTNSTVPASISCNGWLIKSVKFYETPGAGNSATTSIAVGIAANGITTTLLTSLDTATFSTSAPIYVVQDTADGAGQLCTGSQYVSAIMGSAVTTTNGVLSVEYLNYQ